MITLAVADVVFTDYFHYNILEMSGETAGSKSGFLYLSFNLISHSGITHADAIVVQVIDIYRPFSAWGGISCMDRTLDDLAFLIQYPHRIHRICYVHPLRVHIYILFRVSLGNH